MVKLVLILCFSGQCQTYEYPLYGASLLTCVMQGHQEIAKITAARPSDEIKEWRCEPE